MSYLKLDGSITPYEGEALLDFVKLYLSVPTGGVFYSDFGHRNLDESDVNSVRTAINSALDLSNKSITLHNVTKTSMSTITATFSGTDKTIDLETGEL